MNKKTSDMLRERMKELGLTEQELSKRSGVPQSTVHRISSGQSRDPRRSNVLKIAAALKLSEAELFGNNAADSPPNAESGPSIQGKVPIISWVQAGDFCEAIDLFQPGDAEDWIPCPTQHSSSSYALRIQGASMEPKFHEGEIIIVDPEIAADSGRYVIARKGKDKNVTFKQLMSDGNENYLKALNPDWPNRIIQMDEEWHVCGVVICKMELL